jgi:hypothetical protein
MQQQYHKWNQWLSKFLWIVIAVGVIASAPLIAGRAEMEQSSNLVDFVFDYRDLIDISTYKADPQSYIKEQLQAMKEAGVTGLAVYESTLSELENSGSIKLYSAEDAALLNGDEDLQKSNYTYLLFSDTQTAATLEPIIRSGFALYDIETMPWSYEGNLGLGIAVGALEATVTPLDPDPVQLALLQEYGFRISVRLSDARPYDQERMDALFGRLTNQGVSSIIFAGSSVTGYAENTNKLALTGMAELIKKYKLEVAIIDLPLAKQQKGVAKLASLTGFQAVRLHSILEEEASKGAELLADRFVLAVKDRNFRMIYLNARMSVDKEQGTVKVPLANLYTSLNDPEFGAIERIQDLGYTMGQPEPFKQHTNTLWDKLCMALVCLGAIALISRMSRLFLPKLTILVFIAGIGFTALLYVMNSVLVVQALALLAAVSAPTIAVIGAIQLVERRGARQDQASGLANLGWSLIVFIRTILLSLIGAVYTVALLNHVTYILVLNQFRGVSVLHMLPILLVALYVVCFHRTSSFREVLLRCKHILTMNIRVFWVVLAAAAAVVLLYYMSRTGNQGTVSPLERMFRSLLENTLGARPRNKELITHPFIIIGLYLFLRYRKYGILTLFIAGTMGQLSVVDTFAHLHTPLDISLLRVVYGVVISCFIALVYVVVWGILVRSWRRWQHLF